MIKIIDKILDILGLQRKSLSANYVEILSIPRSSSWPKIRKQHLEQHPTCAVCGGIESLQVHHITPFHNNEQLECDLNNLITLCQGTHQCHFLFGHFYDWSAHNPNVVEDAKIWNQKIQNRSF